MLRLTGTFTSFTISRTDADVATSLHAITFAHPAAATPTLSEWGMLGLAGALLVFGALRLAPHQST
jgi:hypothetical protein